MHGSKARITLAKGGVVIGVGMFAVASKAWASAHRRQVDQGEAAALLPLSYSSMSSNRLRRPAIMEEPRLREDDSCTERGSYRSSKRVDLSSILVRALDNIAADAVSPCSANQSRNAESASRRGQKKASGSSSLS